MIVGDEVIPLDTGTIIGIAACEKQRYCCDYIAAEDTVLMEYPYKQVADLEKTFCGTAKVCNGISDGGSEAGEHGTELLW